MKILQVNILQIKKSKLFKVFTNFIYILLFIMGFNYSYSQVRVAVLPFQNMDGKIEKNIICYDLQDSVYKSLQTKDPEHKQFYLVPSDSVEIILANLNLDPSNPQYTSDLWKAVKLLNIKKVIMGNFNLQADKVLINGYIYDVRMKIADPVNQVRDIFKTEEQIFEAVEPIVNAVLPALMPK